MSSTLNSDSTHLHHRNIDIDMNAKPTRLLKADIATAAAPTTEDDEMEPLPSQPNG
ncbi:unnamed protein product, partial [Rotaria socialis]